MKYGEKRDYRKIDVYSSGAYLHSTTWCKTCKEAISKSGAEGLRDRKITAHFAENV